MHIFEIAERRNIDTDDISEIICHSDYENDTISYEWQKDNAHYSFASDIVGSPLLPWEGLSELGLEIIGYYSRGYNQGIFLLRRKS